MLSHVWRASLGSSGAAWRSMSVEFMENGASSRSEESDNNQSRWKKLPHGCSGGFGLWFQVWDEVMRRAVAQRSGSGGWNAYVQRRSTALAAQDKICPAHETKSVSQHIWLCYAPNLMSFTRKRAGEISASICCRT